MRWYNNKGKIKKSEETNVKKLINTLMRLILMTFAVGILLLLVIIMVVSVKHHQKLQEEASLLVAPGKMVSVDGHQMHVMSNETSADVTYVFLHDAKQTDNSIALQPLMDLLQDKAIAYVDRSGNGFSASAHASKDVASMTEETRAALTAADIAAPYILVAEGTAGIEAVYWSNTYPDEVAGIVGIDATYPAECDGYQMTWDTKLVSWMMLGYCRIGGHRYATGMYPTNQPQLYTDKQMELRDALISKSYYNKDTYHELMATYDNAAAAGNIPSDIPILMIWSNPLLDPYYSESEEVQAEVADIIKANPEYDFAGQYNAARLQYFEDYSNVKCIEMAGPSGLIDYNPSGLAEKIEDFSKYVQKD